MDTLLDLKRHLAQTSPWLSAFMKTADEVIQSRLLVASAGADYETLLVEPLLHELSATLDRILSYRREAYELDILATKAAADYALFTEISRIDQILEKNAMQEARLQREQVGFAETSLLFQHASSNEALAQGFSRSSLTQSEAAKDSQALATERQSILERRWKLLSSFQEAYNDRHNTPNNAHNYRERMLRILELLVDDVSDAYARCCAASAGLRQVFSADLPAPPIDHPNIIDSMVMWTRQAIRFIDRESQSENSYDLVVPLTQPWRADEDAIIPPKALRKIIDAKSELKDIKFVLDRIFARQSNLRLRAVGLSFGSTPQTTGGTEPPEKFIDPHSYWRIRATVHTPKQSNPREPGTFYRRPPIALGDVAHFGRPAPLAFSSGTCCHNVHPVGEWRIVLHKAAVWADARDTDIEGSFWSRLIHDLKLHLRVVSKPDLNEPSVFWSKSP